MTQALCYSWTIFMGLCRIKKCHRSGIKIELDNYSHSHIKLQNCKCCHQLKINFFYQVWSSDLTLIREVDAHPVNVNSLAANDNTLYSCSNDGTIKRWNLDNLEAKQQLFQSSTDEVLRLVYTDCKLYSGDDKGNVRKLSLSSSKLCLFRCMIFVAQVPTYLYFLRHFSFLQNDVIHYFAMNFNLHLLTLNQLIKTIDLLVLIKTSSKLLNGYIFFIIACV